MSDRFKGVRVTTPECTPEALRAGVEGFVELSAMSGEDGVPFDIQVVQPLGYGLDAKAIECVRAWRLPQPSQGAPGRAKLYVKFELPVSGGERSR